MSDRVRPELARGVSGQARSGGRGGGWDGGGAGVEGFDGWLIVFMPPPGAGGGSSRLTGHVPSASARDVSRQARAGEGAGVGTTVAQVLRVLMVGLLYLCPRREREGAARV